MEERINFIVDKVEKSFNEGRDPSKVNEELIDRLVKDGMTRLDAAYLCHYVANKISSYVKEEIRKRQNQ